MQSDLMPAARTWAGACTYLCTWHAGDMVGLAGPGIANAPCPPVVQGRGERCACVLHARTRPERAQREVACNKFVAQEGADPACALCVAYGSCPTTPATAAAAMKDAAAKDVKCQHQLLAATAHCYIPLSTLLQPSPRVHMYASTHTQPCNG